MEVQYQLREAVWARVPAFPWWPGKIIKIIRQNEKTVYKVAFFADPTYTFLHSNQLRPFDIAPPQENAEEPQDSLQLQKALQMAKLYVNRLSGKRQHIVSKAMEGGEGENSSEWKTEEMHPQNIVIPQTHEQSHPITTTLDDSLSLSLLNIDEITAENVLEMIDRNRRREKSTSYSYQTRKEEMQVQAELKRKLLMKFNLHHFDAAPSKEPHKQLAVKKILEVTQENLGSKNYRRMCRTKSRVGLLQGETEMLRRRCIRKINSLLKNTNDGNSSKTQSMGIIKRILILAEDNRIKLQSLFVTLVKALASSGPICSCQDRLSEFSNYLQQLQGDKQEDEGSKITQIEVAN